MALIIPQFGGSIRSFFSYILTLYEDIYKTASFQKFGTKGTFKCVDDKQVLVNDSNFRLQTEKK